MLHGAKQTSPRQENTLTSTAVSLDRAIPKELTYLQNSIDALYGEVSALANQIDPIVVHVPEEVSSGADSAAPLCPIACRIMEAQNTILAIRARIAYLTANVQV